MDERGRRGVGAERETFAGTEIRGAIADSGFRFVRGATMWRSEHKNRRKIRSALDSHGTGNCGGPEKTIFGQSGIGGKDKASRQSPDRGGISNWGPAKKKLRPL